MVDVAEEPTRGVAKLRRVIARAVSKGVDERTLWQWIGAEASRRGRIPEVEVAVPDQAFFEAFELGQAEAVQGKRVQRSLPEADAKAISRAIQDVGSKEHRRPVVKLRRLTRTEEAFALEVALDGHAVKVEVTGYELRDYELVAGRCAEQGAWLPRLKASRWNRMVAEVWPVERRMVGDGLPY